MPRVRLLFVTDLAEHYGQFASYLRILSRRHHRPCRNRRAQSVAHVAPLDRAGSLSQFRDANLLTVECST